MSEDTFAKDVTALYAKLEELRIKISELRKIGKDPLLADLILRNLRAKIHYAEITRDKQDIERIKNAINEAEQEIKEAEELKEKTLKDEINELIKRGE
ncbi:MAG: hypothetical protein ABIJ21_04215 [Nanoarchaeota archaeon]